MAEFPPTIALSSLDGAAAYDFSCRSASSAGNVNSDGFDDLVVGAHRADPNGDFSGSSYSARIEAARRSYSR